MVTIKFLMELARSVNNSFSDLTLLHAQSDEVKEAICNNNAEKLKKLINDDDAWSLYPPIPQMVIHQE